RGGSAMSTSIRSRRAGVSDRYQRSLRRSPHRELLRGPTLLTVSHQDRSPSPVSGWRAFVAPGTSLKGGGACCASKVPQGRAVSCPLLRQPDGTAVAASRRRCGWLYCAEFARRRGLLGANPAFAPLHACLSHAENVAHYPAQRCRDCREHSAELLRG